MCAGFFRLSLSVIDTWYFSISFLVKLIFATFRSKEYQITPPILPLRIADCNSAAAAASISWKVLYVELPLCNCEGGKNRKENCIFPSKLGNLFRLEKKIKKT